MEDRFLGLFLVYFLPSESPGKGQITLARAFAHTLESRVLRLHHLPRPIPRINLL